MLKMCALPLGAYQTNCYLVWEDTSSTCVVIDPGYEADTILEKLTALGLSLDAILLTHGHFHHVGAVRQLAADTGCALFLCAEDLTMPPQLTAGTLYYTDLYGEGDILSLAGLSFKVLHTPGHTPGSVCLQCEDTIFSGDTLFWGSCGRTDLPGGSWSTIQKSLKRLAAISGDFKVYPGHGDSTQLSFERKMNPYMQ